MEEEKEEILAVKSITNLLGLGITDITTETVKYKWLCGGNKEKEHKAKIYYNFNNEPYFKDNNGHRQYINEFIRTNFYIFLKKFLKSIDNF